MTSDVIAWASLGGILVTAVGHLSLDSPIRWGPGGPEKRRNRRFPSCENDVVQPSTSQTKEHPFGEEIVAQPGPSSRWL